MKRFIATALLFALVSDPVFAFCGFYVAKADVKLFNKTSQVILVRDGERSIVTMSSDFQGDVKDFAMVVPVPVVLQRSDINVVNRLIFDQLDAYSAPRLVEYYDNNPCDVYYGYDLASKSMPRAARADMLANSQEIIEDKEYNVTIEAKYSVGEYDILILSAQESGGLERWLNDNGYKIPEGAKEVLEPYIKSNMKFFVVKVNLEEFQKQGGTRMPDGSIPLSPIQIGFNSPKFMLPIRLGMANANGPQDMIVYGFSRKGRIEATNYRTVLMPTGQNVPLFVQEEFGEFYHDAYTKAWKREGRNIVMLEYAWDVSLNGGMKCDPCVGPPPMFAELQQAGVNWISSNGMGGASGYVYFTRLHVTYDRTTFPQDLLFQETPNQQNYQARYVLTHPAGGPYDCTAGQSYLRNLSQRRWNEMYTYQWLSGREIVSHRDYPNEYNGFIRKNTNREEKNQRQGAFLAPASTDNNDPSPSMPVIILSIATLIAILFALSRQRKNNPTPSLSV